MRVRSMKDVYLTGEMKFVQIDFDLGPIKPIICPKDMNALKGHFFLQICNSLCRNERIVRKLFLIIVHQLFLIDANENK